MIVCAQLEEFLPVIQLYDLLYPDGEMLDVPDVSDDDAILRMAAICIWIHLGKKAQNDKRRLERAMPHALRRHMEWVLRLRSGSDSALILLRFRSDSAPIPLRFRSDSNPIPIWSRSDSAPIPLRFRFRSDSAPIPVPLRFRSGSAPIPLRFRCDPAPISRHPRHISGCVSLRFRSDSWIGVLLSISGVILFRYPRLSTVNLFTELCHSRLDTDASPARNCMFHVCANHRRCSISQINIISILRVAPSVVLVRL